MQHDEIAANLINSNRNESNIVNARDVSGRCERKKQLRNLLHTPYQRSGRGRESGEGANRRNEVGRATYNLNHNMNAKHTVQTGCILYNIFEILFYFIPAIMWCSLHPSTCCFSVTLFVSHGCAANVLQSSFLRNFFRRACFMAFSASMLSLLIIHNSNVENYVNALKSKFVSTVNRTARRRERK